jgi:transcription initiation factor TFIID subunit TAF12
MAIKLYCPCIHSPSFHQDLAGDGSCGGPQHSRSDALGVKEGQAHFERVTKVRNTVTLIAKKHMTYNRGLDTSSVLDRLVALTIRTGTASATLAVAALIA